MNHLEEQTPQLCVPDTPVKFEWTYRVSLQDYQSFNFILAEPEIKKRRRRSNTLGILEVALGLVMLVSMLTAKAESQALYYVLDAALILMGAYGLCFYRFIFPWQLKKSAAKQYEKNLYLNHDIHLRLYEEGVAEQSYETSQFLPWEEIAEVLQAPELTVFILKSKKCILLPAQVTAPQQQEFSAFLTELHDRCGVPVSSVKKGAGNP